MVPLESLELGDICVDKNTVLATFKVACDKAGLDAKVPEFLVKIVGCRILETLEKITDDAVDDNEEEQVADECLCFTLSTFLLVGAFPWPELCNDMVGRCLSSRSIPMVVLLTFATVAVAA